MIYFVQRQDGLIKIGKSDNPRKRLESLRKEHGNLTPLGVVQGSFHAERRLHNTFSVFRKDGEWFTPSNDILTFIESNAQPFPKYQIDNELVVYESVDENIILREQIFDANTKIAELERNIKNFSEKEIQFTQQMEWLIKENKGLRDLVGKLYRFIGKMERVTGMMFSDDPKYTTHKNENYK